MKRLHSNISRRLVLYIVGFSACITLILTLIQLNLDYKAGIRIIEQRLNQIDDTHLAGITQSLWTLDNDAMSAQLQGLLRIPDIVYLTLSDANESVLYSMGEPTEEHMLSREYPISKLYRDQQVYLGKLRVVATKSRLYQQLIDTTLVILVSQAVKTFLVSAFILFIFYTLVTRHIAHIADYQDNIDLEHAPDPLRLDRKSDPDHEDELDLLVNGFNKMADNYYRSFNIVVSQRDRLMENEARLNAIFNAIADSIIVTDTERRMVLVNEEFHKQFGYADDEVIGNTTRMLYASPEDYDRQGLIRYRVRARADKMPYEISYISKEGRVFPGETLGGHIRLPDGTLIGFIGIIRDITLRKESEEQYRQVLHELQQSQKMESIGHLTGGIAHDFNNILASIIGYTDLALGITATHGDGKLHQYLSHVKTSSERASTLVTQMLTFSRSTPSQPEPLHVDEIINETIEILKPTLPSSIRLETYFDPDTPPIMMDKTQLQQVLINICVNAKDAMESEGILSISLQLKKDLTTKCNSCHASISGDFVDIAISDTGSGIDSSSFNHIFDPFYTTKEVGKGTGMGLSVVHGILHQHDAHLTVSSHKDIGSTFHLLFPPTQDVDQTDENPHVLVYRSDKHMGEGRHVLIIDDEEMILHYLKNLLETYGYRVTLSDNSMEALELLKHHSHEYDLLITDQTMPYLTGLNLVKQIRQMNINLPVIMCSGYSEIINRENARKLGVDAFLDKPLSKPELLNIMQRLIRN